MPPPTGVVLYLAGTELDGHVLHLHVEEGSGSYGTIRGEDVEMPWLRAACSCGWRAGEDERFTIEENAHHLWVTTHVRCGRD